MKECAEPGCANFYMDHKWGSIIAYDRGWFQQKNGTSWCPDHIPTWVNEWRKGK